MKIVGRVLLGLGVFLLVAAVLAVTWAPGVVKKTPLDADTRTDLAGEASYLGSDVAPIHAISTNAIDSEASTDDVVVFVATSCAFFVNDGGPIECRGEDDPSALAIDEDKFATERVSALAVDSDALPSDAVAHEGLVNKWPFDVEQKTYPYWDGRLGAAADAVYDRTEDIDGLETYVFKVSIDQAPTTLSEGVTGTYTDQKEVFVEPHTGSIIDQVDNQQIVLDDGTPALDLQLSVTDESVASAVADAKDDVASLNLITRVVPIVGFVGGVVLILLGIVLMRRSRPKPAAKPAVHREPAAAGR